MEVRTISHIFASTKNNRGIAATPKTLNDMKNFSNFNALQLCEMEFDRLGPFWHLYTDGTKMEDIFKNDQEMKLGVITLGISAKISPQVEIVAFELMANHVHMIIRGERNDCMALFSNFKSRLARILRNLGNIIDWSNFEASILPIESFRSLRYEIIYVHRNAFVIDPRYTPDTYPWGSGCMYFSGIAKNIPTQSLAEIGFNKSRELTHFRDIARIADLRFAGDSVFIPSFCRIDIGESMFQNARSYFNMLTRNAEAFSEIASRLKDTVFLTDDEIYAAATQCAEQNFGCRRITALDPNQRIQLARELHFRFNASKQQLRRILRLEPGVLNELFPSPEST